MESAPSSDEAPRFGICLRVAYDGTDFAGFQRQREQRTVQGELERAAAQMTGHEVVMRGAGRTDAGVHALGQVVAFDSARDIPDKGFRLGLNQKLADDVRVQDVWRVVPGYNPRFDAMGKHYRYVLEVGERKNPLMRLRAWQLGKPGALDLDVMQAAARLLEGTHDYRAFRAADDERENTVRTLSRIDVLRGHEGVPERVAIDVHGTAFMKNMVRILVGTLVAVASGRLRLDQVPELLGPHAVRHRAAQTAPAHGLTLVEVLLGRNELAERSP